ncbi:MAG TPA: flavin reductase family protein [Gemmatimonadaceae bacterium]|nr:flavin reductase family protein [Gemmatimonadaceae bacterium]
MTLDPDAFRAVLGRFASGVTVVTTYDGGRDHGMTVSAFSSVSLAPPLVMVCIGDDASLRPVIEHATYFGVSILAAEQEALSRRFAAHVNRFDGVGFTRGESGVALLDGALALLECRVVARHQAGDHLIVVGEVEAASAANERPLLYYRGGYAQLER